MAKKKSGVTPEMHQKAYWASPTVDPTKVGATSGDNIFLAVGRALTFWERAEESLAYLYIALLGHDGNQAPFGQRDAIFRSFGMVDANSTRRKMIEEIAPIYFARFWAEKKVSEPFTNLMKALMFASVIRNEIAHGKAMEIINHERDGNGNLIPHSFGAFLFAPIYKTDRQIPFTLQRPISVEPFSFSTSKYLYNDQDINEFTEKFQKLGRAIFRYTVSIGKTNGIPANCLEFCNLPPQQTS